MAQDASQSDLDRLDTEVFTKENNKPGNEKVIVLTQSYWQSQYQESPEVIDKVVRIDGATGNVLETIPVGQNPAVVAGVDGDVWVSMFDDSQVWRIHPG